ncbi:MFS transporter [Agromyces intestinalis]|uniref:MFS transporter n=1 Tax=Agromyces intestinalis TaxID=2592652 RepID=A0A5C1YFH7_9MICO|nr:MFS transporter [Agromyces intestinalis]QEO14230.1 MFS transporter [Agromyces intestinalis]
MSERKPRRGLSLAVLIVNQLLAGVGVASGIAVAALLVESLTGTAILAGLSQTCAVLGAGLAAVPLARLAVARGRHIALACGYVLAVLGAGLVITAATSGFVVLAFLGLTAFGAGTAAGLQARFAAAEIAAPGFEARSLSLVLWATTLGSVAGPNLSEFGDGLGQAIGLPPLVGPFVVSGAVFALSTLLVATLLRLPRPGTLAADAEPTASGEPDASAPAAAQLAGAARGRSAAVEAATSVPDEVGEPGAWRALRVAVRDPQALLALLAIVCSHTIMVAVMVMTPVHLHAHGATLGVVGLVLSIHILGMYGASPVMGWLVDRVGTASVIAAGGVILFAAVVIGILAPADDLLLVPVALGLLGLGWSAGMIGGSALLTRSVAPALRVPLQGASDASMNFAAAIASAFSGLLLGLGGFAAVNTAAAFLLVPLAVVWARAVLVGPRVSA